MSPTSPEPPFPPLPIMHATSQPYPTVGLLCSSRSASGYWLLVSFCSLFLQGVVHLLQVGLLSLFYYLLVLSTTNCPHSHLVSASKANLQCGEQSQTCSKAFVIALGEKSTESKRSLKHQNEWHFLFLPDAPETQGPQLHFQLCADCYSLTLDLSSTVSSAEHNKGR